MPSITLQARAKINWTLDVLSRRQDGYHEVDMLMQSIDLFDTLTITLGGKKVDVICEYPFAPNGDANIACKSAELLLDKISSKDGVHVHIKKRIPVAAGLAGGSTDAAGVLVGLNNLYGNPLSVDELKKLAVLIGADVPFCIEGGLQRAKGIGEKLEKLELKKPLHIVLVKPEGQVLTGNIYNSLDLNNLEFRPDNDKAQKALVEGDLPSLAMSMGNVLRGATRKSCKEVDTLCEMMLHKGAWGANMTGSGPTVYGLFENFEDSLGAMRALRHSGVEWCCALSTANECITIV